MTDKLSYRMLHIGGVPAGLLGLSELFKELYEAGFQPEDEGLPELLIKRVRQHNYIPKPALEEYRKTLTEEYRRFFQSNSGGEGSLVKNYGQWEGHPRENIPWFPIVSAELCNGCGKCLEVCPKDVFVMDEGGKAVVIEPFFCIVGCCFCKSACDPGAIIMPNREMLDSFRHGPRKST